MATIVMLAGASGAHAAPVKLILADHFGREVNLTEVNAKGGPALEDVCTVESKDTCQAGRESSLAGGFSSPESVAAAPNGNVYVADAGNRRVQELTSSGQFVLMFGKGVNETTGGDICTAASGNACKAGVEGAAAGQFGEVLMSVAVDPVGGDVYVAEKLSGESGGKRVFSDRIQKFTAAGLFVLEIGREVNETTKGDICTEEEIKTKGVKCKGSVPTGGSSEHGAFNFEAGGGNLLAVGGPEDLLYVGDEHRVQEFKADGTWAGEIPLTSISSEPEMQVSALAVAGNGDLYLVYGTESTELVSVVHEFKANGEQILEFPVTPRESNTRVIIYGLALDSSGHLAVSSLEPAGYPRAATSFGSLHTASTGHLITEFTVPSTSKGIAFNGEGELYSVSGSAAGSGQEVLVYKTLPVAELLASTATCKAGAETETSATFDCTLHGEINPFNVPETEVLFEWGTTPALGTVTAKQPIATGGALVPVSAAVQGLRPNETVYDRLAGYDHNVQPPEKLTSEKASLMTPLAAPEVVGEPSVSFVKSSSAVMSGELNPENANTRYEFQYGPCENLESCPSLASTAVSESAVYGKIGATLEARGLQPGTVYYYRLLAASEDEGKTTKLESRGPVGSFTTAPAPNVQAATGPASAVTATSALVSGSVNPDGQPATYTFELGVYNGASTQYGVVFSGATGAGTVPVEESLALSGLQPGTSYAYRIIVHSGYGTAEGQPTTFTTAGVLALLFAPSPLTQLAIPAIAFPKAVTTTTKALTNAQKLSKALRVCKKRSKKQRATCEKQARKKYKKK